MRQYPSANADQWVEHCEQICLQWQVPLQVVRVTLADEGLGIEAHARQARYQAFREALLPGEALLTAQHLDDQCETFLLALKRGSGPTGIVGIVLITFVFNPPQLMSQRPLMQGFTALIEQRT
jgi:tRNA(Ile)-lysidine synthase TilS/MesJ